MALLNCFSTFAGKKKKVKVDGKNSPGVKNNGLRTLQVKLERPAQSSEPAELNSTSLSIPVPFDVSEESSCKVKLIKPESPVNMEAVEVAYEGEDERDDKSSIKRDDSDCNLQMQDTSSGKLGFQFRSTDVESNYANEEVINDCSKINSEEDANNGLMNMIESGHISDPGMAREKHWDSPKLKRSCSSLDTREVLKKIADKLPPSKSQSYEQLQELAQKVEEDVLLGSPCSQASALSHRSADKVMLKKHSSSQILPSRSRKLWWKLFLWSHRNLQKPKTQVSHIASLNQQGGYSSDTLEAARVKQVSKLEPPGSLSEMYSEKSGHKSDRNQQRWDGFRNGVSGLWPQNQWVAFSGEPSPLKRVEDWVKDLDIQSTTSSIEVENDNEQVNFPPSPEATGLPAKGAINASRHNNRIYLSEELLHANSVIQSLNSSSTVAHISGIGLKAIPLISHFSSLRSVNLSNNSIAQITPGSLPKSLHVLDLSRNKIGAIEGLRELSRLRVLDLSYNRISRIGHGLANCALLKELYLAGNKISEVEGLHRLLKLTVLDLSFNKITTTKAIGQLVANYNSLLALNLLGNPIQSNLSDDQLRKAVCGLLPKLAYLNKQPVNHQKAREVSMDIITKASSRNSSRSVHRRSVKKTSQSQSGGAFLSSAARSNANVVQKSQNRLKGRINHHSNLKIQT